MWQKTSPTFTEEEKTKILPMEERSVNFVSFLLENTNPPASWFPSGVLIKSNTNNGFIGIKGKNLVLPFFLKSPNPGEIQTLKPLLTPSLGVFFSIMGPKEWTDSLKAAFDWNPYKAVQYHLMTLDQSPPPLPNMHDMEVLPVAWENAGLVFPLQEGYEKEEVLFSPQEFQKTASTLAFQKTLKTQKVLALFQRGKALAKAHTNARGWNWNQIGGVYTREENRGQGLGSLIVQALCLWSFQNSKKVSLFVKKHNSRAIQLYQGLGFQIREDFEILYYQKSRT